MINPKKTKGLAVVFLIAALVVASNLMGAGIYNVSPDRNELPFTDDQMKAETATISVSAWMGFFGNLAGAFIAASVAIGLWFAERNREIRLARSARKKEFHATQSWLRMELRRIDSICQKNAVSIDVLRSSVSRAINSCDEKSIVSYEYRNLIKRTYQEFEAPTNNIALSLDAVTVEWTKIFGENICNRLATLTILVADFFSNKSATKSDPANEDEANELLAHLMFLANNLRTIKYQVNDLNQELEALTGGEETV